MDFKINLIVPDIFTTNVFTDWFSVLIVLFFPPTEQHPDPKISSTHKQGRGRRKNCGSQSLKGEGEKERTVSMQTPHNCYTATTAPLDGQVHSLHFLLTCSLKFKAGCLRYLNNRVLP